MPRLSHPPATRIRTRPRKEGWTVAAAFSTVARPMTRLAITAWTPHLPANAGVPAFPYGEAIVASLDQRERG
jgi:hypothetical protein